MIRRWKFGALVIAIFTALVAVPAIAVADDDDDDDDRSTRTYEVTIENLTGAQILTPPVFAGHNRGFDLFSAGQPASVWLKEVSEMESASAHLVVAEGADHHAVLDQARHLLTESYGIHHGTFQVEPQSHEGCHEVAW